MDRRISVGIFAVALALAFGGGVYWGKAGPSDMVEAEGGDLRSEPRFGAKATRVLPQGADEIVRAAGKDFPALWERGSKEGSDRKSLRLLAARWIDVDLSAALAFFSAREGGPAREFLTEFALADSAAALSYARGLPDDLVSNAVRSILSALAGREPALVAAELLRNPDPDAFVRDIITTVIRRDPTLAPALLDAADDRNRVRLAGEWEAVDPEAALAWCGKMAAPEGRNQAMQAVVTRMVASDPAAALASLDFPDEHRRKYYLESVAKVIGESTDVETGVTWVLDHAPENSHRDMLFSMFANADCATALQLLDAVPAGPMRDSLLKNAWMNWSDPEVAPALAWIDANVPEERRAGVYGVVASGLAARDFEAALRALDTLPEGPSRSSYEAQLFIGRAQQGGREGGEEALGMILGRYDEGRAHEIIGGAFPQIAGLNEEAAEVFLAALPVDFRNQHPSYLMANVWVKQNREEAMAWAAALPMGDGREDALRGLANELPPNEATAAWFNGLPPSAGRDAIAERLAGKVMGEDPAQAFAWAQSISGESERAARLRSVVALWAGNDPAAASAAIAGADLSERERSALALRLGNQLRVQP